MTKEVEAKIKELLDCGCTDEDIAEVVEEYGADRKEVWIYVHEYDAGPQCKGCKHIAFYADMWPCTCCSRIRKLQDRYEAREVTESEG